MAKKFELKKLKAVGPLQVKGRGPANGSGAESAAGVAHSKTGSAMVVVMVTMAEAEACLRGLRRLEIEEDLSIRDLRRLGPILREICRQWIMRG